jgi:two-component system, NarL family, response regulator DegU
LRRRHSLPYPEVRSVENIRILITEDDPMLRSFLEEVIAREQDMEVVGAFGDGREALDKTLELQPDILILDLYLDVYKSGMNGLEVLRELAERSATTRVLVLTVDGSEEMVLNAFRAGAKGFLPKLAAKEHLAKAIRAVAADETWIDRRTTSRLVEELEYLTRKAAEVERPDAALSEREKEVLACIGRGLTNAQIAKELFLSERTVKVHVSHILHKLSLPNRTGAALFARRFGLIAEEPPRNGGNHGLAAGGCPAR